MSEKPCSTDCGKHRRIWLYRSLLGALFAFILLVALVILIIYLVLHPHKPRFYLQDARVNQLNLTSNGLLTSNLQFTILSRNPNDKIGIYYDHIDEYVSYRGQQITSTTFLQPFYQGHNDDVVFTSVLVGDSVPLAPYLCNYLSLDLQYAALRLNVKLDARVRWKVGTWRSGHYSLNVNCDTVLGVSSTSIGGPVPLHTGVTKCDVDV